MKLSIITTCKGRLDHLKQCLPSWLIQTFADVEIVMVDYNCPEQSGNYCEGLGEGIVVVRPEGIGKYFNLSHARNIGALSASGDVMFFIDADTTLDNDFIQHHIDNVLVDGRFLSGWFYGDATGSCIVWARDFKTVRGFNENVEGWGFDDIDFYKRLEAKGIEQKGFERGIVTIKHGDEDRVKHYHSRNLRATDMNNQRKTKQKFISCIL